MKTQHVWRTLAALLAASFLAVTGMQAQAQDTLRFSLRDAAVRAAADNPVMHASHRDVEASEKQLSKAWREYVPTITANARYNYLNDDIQLGIPTITLPLPPKGLFGSIAVSAMRSTAMP